MISQALPLQEKHMILPMTLDDLDELAALHAEYLNYGPGIRPHFAKVLSNAENISLKYTIEGQIVGIYIYTKGISLSGEHPELQSRLERMTAGKKVYTGDAILVRDGYRSVGVTKKLCSAMLHEVVARRVDFCLHELWVHPDGRVPALNVVNRFPASVFLGRIENFYRRFHHYGYLCPICKKDCVCAAEIYLSRAPETEHDDESD